MITFVHSPWKDTRWHRYRNIATTVMLLFALLIGFFSVFGTYTAKAQDNSQATCNSFRLIGDRQGVNDLSAGIKGEIRNKLGVVDFDSRVYRGRDVQQVAREIRNSDVKDHCIIIEAGSGNLKQSDEEMRAAIMSAINELSTAPRVFWVTPIVDNTRAEDGLKSSNDRFNSILREMVDKEARNIEIIDIRDLANQGDLFTNNPMIMKDSGYKKRVENIVGQVSNKTGQSNASSNPNSSNPTSSNPTSSSPTGSSAPTSTPGGGGGGGGGGGNQGSIYSSGAETGGDNPSNTDVCSSSTAGNGTCKLPNQMPSSPKGVADHIFQIASFGEAKQYLMTQRWVELNFPTAAFSIADPGTARASLTSGFAWMLFGASNFIVRILQDGLIISTGDILPSVGMRIANSTFGELASWYTTGEGGAARLTIVATSIVTITGIFALLNAMQPSAGGSIKQRIIRVAWSVLRAMLSIMFLVFVAVQSAKSPGAFRTEEGRSAFQVTQGGTGRILQDNNSTFNNNEDYNRASSFSSWNPLSIGWFLSVGYWAGNQIAGAIYNLGALVVLRPIEVLSNPDVLTSKDIGKPACDKYADAINLAFKKTAIAQDSQAVATMLSILDYVFYSYQYTSFKFMYGGQTFQAGSSFCMVLENNNGIPGGESLLLARSSGLFKEVAGSGNILTNDTRYTHGEHSATNIEHNLKEGLPGFKRGLLVDEQGNWTNSDGAYNPLLRSEYYLGRKGPASGQAKALYYFASCRWVPEATNAELHSSWRGVQAMGPTGARESDGKTQMPPMKINLTKFVKEGEEGGGFIPASELDMLKGVALAGYMGGGFSLGPGLPDRDTMVREMFDSMAAVKGDGEEAATESSNTKELPIGEDPEKANLSQEEEEAPADDGEGDSGDGEGDSGDGEGDSGDGEGDSGDGEGDSGDGEGDSGDGGDGESDSGGSGGGWGEGFKERLEAMKKAFKMFGDGKNTAEAYEASIPSPSNNRMTNADCQNAFVYPLDIINNNGVGLTGWGTRNQWADRWDYTPLPPPSLNQLIKSGAEGILNNIPGVKTMISADDIHEENQKGYRDGLAGAWDGVVNWGSKSARSIGIDVDWDKDLQQRAKEALELSDEELEQKAGEELMPLAQKIDPSTAFDRNTTDSGKNPARSFWEISNGSLSINGAIYLLAPLLVLVISLCIAFALLLPIIVMILLGFILLIYMVTIGGALAGSIIMFAFRGGVVKKNG